MENDKIINGDCWVAYFDVLGFKNMVKDFEVELIRETFKKAIEQGGQFNSICRFKFFSDTFIFYTENDSLDSFRKIRDVTMYFFSIMFADYQKSPRFPMRACLNVGQLYSDEKDGILYGQAFIDAHDLAEGQNWIGFVLSEKAIEKINEYERAGIKTDNERWFQEYDVPCKKEPKEKKLFAYKMNSLFEYSLPQKLYERLYMMWFDTSPPLTKENCSECKKILTKYINTENYLRTLYTSSEKEKKRFDQDELCFLCENKRRRINSKSLQNTM